MQQCATLGSARLSLLVWNDSACPTTARELPQRTPAIVPQQESERSGIDGRRLLLSARCGSVGAAAQRRAMPAKRGARRAKSEVSVCPARAGNQGSNPIGRADPTTDGAVRSRNWRRGGQGHLAARALLLSHRRRSGRQPWRLLDTAVSGSYEERPASASEPRREAWVSWSGSHVGPRS